MTSFFFNRGKTFLVEIYMSLSHFPHPCQSSRFQDKPVFLERLQQLKLPAQISLKETGCDAADFSPSRNVRSINTKSILPTQQGCHDMWQRQKTLISVFISSGRLIFIYDIHLGGSYSTGHCFLGIHHCRLGWHPIIINIV